MNNEQTQPLNISLDEAAKIWVGILLSHIRSKKLAEAQKQVKGEKGK